MGRTAADSSNIPKSELLTQWIGEVAKGDRSAFARIFEVYAPRINAMMVVSGFKPDAAEELSQETMLKVWRSARSYDPAKAGVSAWIYAISHNVRIDRLRKQQKDLAKAELPINIDTETVTYSDNQTDQRQTKKILAHALKGLPEDQSVLVELSYFQNKSQSTIAHELSLPLGTVKSRLRLALSKLRRSLRGIQ